MKTILMLIVGLMLADCGSMENHVRNRDAGGHDMRLPLTINPDPAIHRLQGFST
jgi:hypothetical protein